MLLKLEDHMLPCINKTVFGFDCMGCGFQRSILFLLKGEFFNAFKMYPAIYSLILLVLFLMISLKFKFQNSHKILLSLFLVNIFLITGNFIIKIIT